MKNILICLVFIGCSYACATLPAPTPTPAPDPAPAPTPNPEPAPAPVPVGPSCATACARFQELKCPEGDPTNDGASCETVCTNMQTANLITYDLACATKIENCAGIESCPRQ